MKPLSIIEASSEAGAGTRGSSLGPEAVYLESLRRKSGLFNQVEWVKSQQFNHEINPENGQDCTRNWRPISKSVHASYQLIKSNLEAQKRTLILSGDHSNAVAGISALSDHQNSDQIGLVWIDAHADLHSPFTTPSGNVHGMPLAAMLNEDNLSKKCNEPDAEESLFWEEIKKLGDGTLGKIKAEHIVFIAIRDLEAPEWDLIKAHNIKYFEPKDILELGIEEVIKQAKDHLKHLKQWYVSFDVDSVDPSISMGTGTPVALGLTREEAFACTSSFFNDEKTGLFEISEINPLLDEQNKMAGFAHDLIGHMLK